jgi:hypothetical protein
MKQLVSHAALLAIALLLLAFPGPVRSAEVAKEDEAKVALKGTVTTPDGAPAADVSVTFGYGEQALKTATDKSGQFTLQAPRGYLRGAPLTVSDGKLLMAEQNVTDDAKEGEAPKPLAIKLEPARQIEVSIVDEQGAAVPDAEVTLVGSFRTLDTERTDAAGQATFAAAPTATLDFVLATKLGGGVGYQLFRHPQQAASDPYQLPQDHAQPVTVKLAPTRTVTIHVEDQQQQPIAGVDVTPWHIQLAKHGGNANLGLLWSAKTNEQGDATFPHIPVKNETGITFWTRKEGLIAPERTNLNAKDAADRLVATLLPLTSVSGRVVREDGSPAAGAQVVAAGSNGNIDDYRGGVVADEEGRFTLQVNPDCYCMFAASDGEQASPAVCRLVRLGEAVDELKLKLQPASTVRGRVTAGGKPASKQYVSLYRKATPDYYKLPADEQLPEREGRFAVNPLLIQSMPTDEEGGYQFLAGPGDYYLIVNNLEDPPTFTISDQREVEHELALNLPPEGELAGRVVLADKPEQGVAEIAVFSYPEEFRARHIRATTDGEGRFKHQVAGAASLLGAFNEDKSLGVMERIAGDQKEVTLALSPTATATAVVIDEETGSPAADREVVAYIRIGKENGPFMHGFPTSGKTDAEGRVSLRGLLIGPKYEVNIVTKHDADGNARGWQTVGKVEAKAAEELALGELRIPKPYRPPTVDDDIARAYGHKDVAQRLQQLLKDAKLGYYHVLVVAADPKGVAGRRYFEICHFSMDGPQERPEKLHEFLVLAVDPQTGGELLAAHELSAPQEKDHAAFAILNPSGAVVATASSDDLSKDGKLDAKLLGEFLANRETPLPNARKLLADALAQAKRENKRLLVQVGGPGCSWCVVLARYLDEQKSLVEKDYLHVKIDSRMPEAKEVIGELREKKEGGVPWMTILDADGKTLITSDGEEGNIGYPGEPKSQEHWLKMLTSTKQRLTDDDVAALMKPLNEKK